jgi:ABC-type lipoprotein release transport system permease subunit
VRLGTSDPYLLVVTAAGILALCALASWAPLRKAWRVDPVETLRQE